MEFKGTNALYPILDAGFLAGVEERAGFLRRIVLGLAEAGVGILQYRNKMGDRAEILADARVMREAFSPMSQNRDLSASSGQAMGHPVGSRMLLILNDWPELAVEAGFDGVHVGQTDMSPAEARAIVGPEKIVGVSTHNEAQLRAADQEPVDYIAVGPVYATATKENPDPVVGLEGVRLARSLTRKPLVGIGGITAENAGAVLEAGADSVAVISGIFAPGGDPAKLATNFPRH
jgi:thiamine-phosphate pyrophosphorylase